jgi:hypothetical protein
VSFVAAGDKSCVEVGVSLVAAADRSCKEGYFKVTAVVGLALITLAAFLALKLPLASESGLFCPVVGDISSECVIITCRQGIVDKVR